MHIEWMGDTFINMHSHSYTHIANMYSGLPTLTGFLQSLVDLRFQRYKKLPCITEINISEYRNDLHINELLNIKIIS